VHLLLVAIVVFGVMRIGAAEWKNIDEAHYVGGRKCSVGYLQGKVALVCRDKEQATRMEEIWTGFKSKPFVLIGAYDKLPKDISYPVYKDVALAEKSPRTALYLVDSVGKVRYFGADEHRATELLVTLLTDLEAPKSEEQWRQFLDYEFATLPGRAYGRYLAYKKEFPLGAKDYAERYDALLKIPEIKKLAELVQFSKSVKDMKAIDPKKARMIKTRLKGKITTAESKYASLKESKNPLVAQEAKNALADLAWAKATLQ